MTSPTLTPHFCGRRLLEHLAHGAAHLAHGLDVMAHAARAVGVLVAVLGLVAGRLDDLHPAPVGLHLVGDHHRQAGARAGTHLGAMGDQSHRAVGRDRDEHVRIGDQAVRHVGAAGVVRLERLGCVEGHELHGDDQARPRRRALEETAPADILDQDALSRGRDDRPEVLVQIVQHRITLPSPLAGPPRRSAGSIRTGRCSRPSR